VAGRYVVGTLYRTGPRAVVITWRDGSTTTHPARALVVLEHQPLKVRGRLFRYTGGGTLEYEAPALVPSR
jgi:hypothetical protein